MPSYSPLFISHSSQTFFLASSLSLSSVLPSSFSFSLLTLSFSLTALSYAFPSSVFFGAFTPNAPAIILPAAALDFSGLLSGTPGPLAVLVVLEVVE